MQDCCNTAMGRGRNSVTLSYKEYFFSLYKCNFHFFPLISGKITMWNLAFHTQCGPIGVHSDTEDTKIIEMYPALYYPISTDVTGFTRLYQVDILPEFHKQHHFYLTLKGSRWFSYLGSTSYCKDFEIKNALTDELLAKGVFHHVRVNFETRRPSKLPQKWYREISRDQLTRSKPPQSFQQPPQPSKCYLYTTLVVSSSTDCNQHQNMAIYLRDCWNAGSAAACQNQLSQFKADLAYYKVKFVSFLYQGEVLVGDTLQVACWEHDSNSNTLCFTMTKGSKVVGQCQMEFYPESQDRSSTLNIKAKL